MSDLAAVISADPFTSLAVAIVPWLLGRAFAWWKTERRRKREDNEARAHRALEAGVNEAWESFGRNWKAARPDGKLTEDERESLRERAGEIATQVARREGLDLAGLFGGPAVNLLIRKIVEGRKGGS